MIWISALLAACVYFSGVRAFGRRRGKPWPPARSIAFASGIVSALIAISSPLDVYADSRFSAHMVQHLILTDITAPLLLLGAPVLLALSASSTRAARRIVGFLRSPLIRVCTFPPASWAIFILSLWAIHFTPFFDAALDNESLHILEHGIFIGSATLFWLPIIAIGPTPWVDGPLSFPLRMLYILIAMPAEGFVGFAIYGAGRVMHPHYIAAGLNDQRIAGELMWIGSGIIMFAAFMWLAYEWGQAEQRAGERFDLRQSS